MMHIQITADRIFPKLSRMEEENAGFERNPVYSDAPIGITTLHYGFNEGAILQAYALSRLIETLTGVPAKVVDQRYPGKVARYTGTNQRTSVRT